MKQELKDLILNSVEMHNNLVNELGENDFHHKKLKKILIDNDVKAVTINEDGLIKVILPETTF